MGTYTGSDKRIAYLFEHGGGGSGGESGGVAAGWKDVTDKITLHSGIVLDSAFVYRAYQIANIVFIYASGSITSGYANAGTMYSLFDVDASIAIQTTASNHAWGSGDYKGMAVAAKSTSTINVNGGNFINFELTWYVEDSYFGAFGGIASKIYSTDEHIVGLWTDGKFVYEKTVIFLNNALASGDNTLSLGISDIDVVCDTNVVTTNSSHTNVRPINTYPYDATSDALYYRIDTVNGAITIRANATWRSPNIYVTLQYTKTTDQGGHSMSSMLHYYSTTEQVVGIWHDGKPVYQKTYIGLALTINSTTSWFRTGIVIPNIKMVVGAEAIDTSNQFWSPNVAIYSADNELGMSLATLVGASGGRIIDTLTVRYTKTTD